MYEKTYNHVLFGYLILLSYGSEIRLHFVVHNQDKRSTSTSENVGESTLEESLGAFLGVDLFEAVNSTIVQNFLSTRLHHQSSSNGIKRIRKETGKRSYDLSNKEFEENTGLGVRQKGSLSGIVTTEIAGSVGNDTKDGNSETLIETFDTIMSSDLIKAINKTNELSISGVSTNISSESGSGKIEGVDEYQRSSTSSTTRGEVTHEEFPEVSSWVIGAENLLVGILEGKVKGLSGERSENGSEVTSPESRDTFFLGNSDQNVYNAFVSLVTLKLLVSSLGLEKELDSLNGSYSSL